MRAILVHADDSPASEVRLQTALDLARLTGGHVTLHINTPLQRYVAMDPFGGTYLAAGAIADAQARDAALTDRLAAKLTIEDVAWRIEASETDLADALAMSAQLADIVVVSLDSAETSPRNRDAVGFCPSIGRLVFAADAPVLALPASTKAVAFTGTAVVAWNGTSEAANALRRAVPLLALAEAVHLVRITDPSERGADRFPATDALQYLSSHDIHAELHERDRGALSVEEGIETLAGSLAADWLVMGAYGHNRWRETLFGGVTRYLIDGGRWPLLLAH